ncbi:D-inositol 3-phosphate glycosyltransferase [Pontiella desulfatans]|uniref:D-inositol 3-phosphate glycosyltransferase n=1 Tax=Pontiella desulfatans TaxID=2750659 RepID=A0A6C2TY54_PONDE|nr:glycosyltransferase [Pontiella desulfatans]VGO12281.1 D-inositol 3-phosphate glycosyltransferase [Pontiella desulfatans]
MSKGLNIALVGGSLSGYAGGAPRSLAVHAKALHGQGTGVTIFAGFSKKYPLTPEQFGLDGIEVVASRLWGPSVLGLNVKALGMLFKRAREFDVIHLNGHWNFTTFIGATIAKIRKVPYVITVRGHLGKYDFEHLRPLKKILFPTMEMPNIKGAALMHVCSEWEKTDSMRALKFAKRIEKIPNAVDVSKLLPMLERSDARKQLDLPIDVPVYLYLARVSPDKSPEMLINAWAASTRKTDGSMLVIAGPYDPEYGKKLFDLVDDLGVKESIRFPGYADNEAKRKWLSASDVFVLPSTDDSFSVAVIEAARFGLHCILSPYVGAAEYIPSALLTTAELHEEAWAKALSAAHPRTGDAPTDWMDLFTLEGLGQHWMMLYGEIADQKIGCHGTPA